MPERQVTGADGYADSTGEAVMLHSGADSRMTGGLIAVGLLTIVVLALSRLYHPSTTHGSTNPAHSKAAPATQQNSSGGVVLASSLAHNPHAEKFCLKVLLQQENAGRFEQGCGLFRAGHCVRSELRVRLRRTGGLLQRAA